MHASIDLGTHVLTLARGSTQVEVRGACVRALAGMHTRTRLTDRIARLEVHGR